MNYYCTKQKKTDRQTDRHLNLGDRVKHLGAKQFQIFLIKLARIDYISFEIDT